MVVDYNPASIVSATFDKQPVITPNYYGYPKVKVGGETRVNINLQGDFSSGLKLGLRDKLSPKDYYSMQRVGENISIDEKDIPYFVNCESGCVGGNKGIINTQGIPQIDNASNRLNVTVTNNGKSADIRLNVGFSDVELEDLKAGEYQGAFTLVFEAML